MRKATQLTKKQTHRRQKVSDRHRKRRSRLLKEHVHPRKRTVRQSQEEGE